MLIVQIPSSFLVISPLRPNSRMVLSAMAKGGETVGTSAIRCTKLFAGDLAAHHRKGKDEPQQRAKDRRKHTHYQRVAQNLAHDRPVIRVEIAGKIFQVKQRLLY